MNDFFFADDSSVPLTVPKGVIEVNEINWESVSNASLANNSKLTSSAAIFQQDQGSNSWCISGKFTADGKPILAADPHLAITIPSIWFHMHLKCDEFDSTGATFVGTLFTSIW